MRVFFLLINRTYPAHVVDNAIRKVSTIYFSRCLYKHTPFTHFLFYSDEGLTSETSVSILSLYGV